MRSELQKQLKKLTKQHGKQAKSMKYQPKNTETKNVELARRAVQHFLKDGLNNAFQAEVAARDFSNAEISLSAA